MILVMIMNYDYELWLWIMNYDYDCDCDCDYDYDMIWWLCQCHAMSVSRRMQGVQCTLSYIQGNCLQHMGTWQFCWCPKYEALKPHSWWCSSPAAPLTNRNDVTSSDIDKNHQLWGDNNEMNGLRNESLKKHGIPKCRGSTSCSPIKWFMFFTFRLWTNPNK